jgi:hypothetical protein
MLSRLFHREPPLDEASIQWLFDVFGWALRYLDARTFFEETILVTPTNEHFPGRADSPTAMAQLILARTAGYAGMAHWPMRLVGPGEAPPPAVVPRVEIPGGLRRMQTAQEQLPAPAEAARLSVGYDPALVGNPEALIAGFAQVLAHYLGSAVQQPVPGGLQNWPQTTEVLGVFLGFGLMFANTAFEFRPRSCGSCGGPPATREAFLSQYDITYALAIFCTLKGIRGRAATSHLKQSLRPHFRRCMGDLARREPALATLRDAA